MTAILRITLGAFLTSQETTDAVEALRNDGNLFRSQMDIQLGGIDAAVEYLGDKRSPALLIVESDSDTAGIFEELDSLANVCDPNSRVILIGSENDISLYRDLMGMGLNDYILKPATSAMIKDSIVKSFDGGANISGGRTISFFSFTGGNGSSVLAHNTAIALSERYEAQVIVVDLDIAFGTASLNFNLQPRQTVADALAQVGRLDPRLLEQIMVEHDDRVSLLMSPSSPNNEMFVTSENLNALMRALRPLADFLIFDVPHLWTPWVIDVLAACDELVLVACPDLTNLRNGKSMVEFLSPKRGIDSPTRLVMNQVGKNRKHEIQAGDLKNALALEPSVTIPYDIEAFGSSLNSGELLFLSHPKSKPAQAIDDLAGVVSSREKKAPEKKGMLSGLFSKKKAK